MILDKVKTLLLRRMADAQPAAPVTTARTSTYGLQKFFDRTGRDTARLRQYRHIYEQGGLVAAAIQAYPLHIFRNGYRLEGDANSVAHVKTVLQRVDWERKAWEAVVEALITGDGIQEVVPSRGSPDAKTGPGSVAALYNRDATWFEFVTNSSGDIVQYVQRRDEYDKNPVAVTPDRIIHLQLYHSGEKPYGDSLIGRAYDDILRDVIISEGSANAIKRHGFPKYHIKAGSPERPATLNEIQALDKEFQDIGSKNDFVTTHDVEILNIDNGGITGLEVYDRISVQRVCAALGVPGEILGFREGTTDNTALARIKNFYYQIRALQHRVEDTYNKHLVDRITGTPGKVRLVLNPVDQPSEDELITMFDKVVRWDPLDPERFITKEQIYKRLGWTMTGERGDVVDVEE